MGLGEGAPVTDPCPISEVAHPASETPVRRIGLGLLVHSDLAKQWRGLVTRYYKLAITSRAAYILCVRIAWRRV